MLPYFIGNKFGGTDEIDTLLCPLTTDKYLLIQVLIDRIDSRSFTLPSREEMEAMPAIPAIALIYAPRREELPIVI